MNRITGERLRSYYGPTTDTGIWDGFALRPDDVIVCTPPKCGTTWMLHIVMMLIYGKAVPDAGNNIDAPWLDCGFRDREEIAERLSAMTRRRCIKTHTPLDGITYAQEPTYIVVFRHPVDVHFSFRKHVSNMKRDTLDHLFPPDIGAGFRRFVSEPLTETGTSADDLTVASLAQHYLVAREREGRGNLHFFHYADLNRDLRGQIARLDAILKTGVAEEDLDAITEATTFSAMRKVVEKSERRFAEDQAFDDMAKFFDSGTSNKWEGQLSEADLAPYHARMAELLQPQDVAWLEWGDRRRP